MSHVAARTVRFLVLAIAVALVATGTASRTPDASAQGAQPSVTIAGFSSDGWPSAQAIVAVQNANGGTIADLEGKDFAATIAGEQVAIPVVTRAVDSSLPIAVVLALDTSGSMAGAPLDQAKAAAHSFLDGLGPNDSVAVVTFGTTATTLVPLTTDRAAVIAAIDGLAADGTTSLYDATIESLNAVATSDSARRAVVLLSDGGIGVLSGRATRDEAVAATQSRGVPVFGIGLGADIDRDYLGDLAMVSGGQFAETPSPEGLVQLYQNVAEQLRGQYVLQLDASGLAVDRTASAPLHVEVQNPAIAASADRTICPQAICVSLVDVTDGARFETAGTIVADVVSQQPVTSVSFVLDGGIIERVTAPPYEVTLDPSSYASGAHELSVTATAAAGETASKDVNVELGAAGGSGLPVSPMLLVVGAVVVLLIAIVVWLFLRRRHGDEDRPSTVPDLPSEPPPAPAEPRPLWQHEPASVSELAAVVAEERPGTLLGVAGPLTGETFGIGKTPTSIGSGSRCQIRLEDGVDIPAEYARVWVRDGRLMVHEVKHLTEYGAAGGTWEILAPHDMFTVGPHTFQFFLTEHNGAETSASTESVPVPLKAFVSEDVSLDSPSTVPPQSPPLQAAVTSEPEPEATAQATDVVSSVETEPPSVLREPTAESAHQPLEPAVPNIFRDWPERPAKNDETHAVPNVLRDRPEQETPGEASQDGVEPPSNGHVDPQTS